MQMESCDLDSIDLDLPYLALQLHAVGAHLYYMCQGIDECASVESCLNSLPSEDSYYPARLL